MPPSKSKIKAPPIPPPKQITHNEDVMRFNPALLRCAKCKKKDNDLQFVMVTAKDGYYVTHLDYLRLDDLCKRINNYASDLSCENIKLCLEIRRLKSKY